MRGGGRWRALVSSPLAGEAGEGFVKAGSTPVFTSELPLAFLSPLSPASSEVAHAPGMGEKLPGAVSTSLLPQGGREFACL